MSKRLLVIFALFSLWACTIQRGSPAPATPSTTAAPVAASLPRAEVLVTAGGGAPPPDQSQAPIPVSAEDPQLGRADAPVTIVEFSDFQCPFCARVNPTLQELLQSYGPERLRLVWKHNPLPFHRQARPAHVAAAAVFELAGSAAFWRFHESAFANQQQLTDEHFEAWAQQAGVDVQRFRARLSSAGAKVDADMALAQRVGANGTPNFFINGVSLKGAQPVDAFKAIIDRELAEIAALTQQGAIKGDLYTLRTQRNFSATAAVAVTTPSADDDGGPWQVPVLRDDPSDGPATALVTIVEWSDFQCPFCKRVEDTLAQVKQSYGDDVRIVWKDNPLPFHPRALPAALLARQVFNRRGNQAFWAIKHELFESNPKLEVEDLRRIAGQHGLTWNESAALADGKATRRIEQNVELADDLEARGTPHFFINGVRLSGAQPLEKFKELIDAELAKARALVETGVSRAKIYETLQKEARGPRVPERKEIPIPASSPFRGPAKAKVVVQEFSDFECPFCKRVQPTLLELEKAFPGQIQIVWRHLPLPFHKDARAAAEAAEEVRVQLGNRAFWAFHDKLFANQGTEAGLSRENLLEMARSVGADVDKVSAALVAGTHRARVQADADAAAAAGISATPTFVINGYVLSGAQPLTAFKKAVRRANGAPRSQ